MRRALLFRMYSQKLQILCKETNETYIISQGILFEHLNSSLHNPMYFYPICLQLTLLCYAQLSLVFITTRKDPAYNIEELKFKLQKNI